MSRQSPSARSGSEQGNDGPWRRAVERRLTAVGAVVLLLVGVCTGVWAAGGRSSLIGFITASDAGSNGCATQEIFLGVRGSGEADGMGPLVTATYDQLARAVRAQGVTVARDWPSYTAVSVPDALEAGVLAGASAASYDGSYHQGIDSLETKLLHWSNACPGAHFVLAGYSQGADVVGATVAEMKAAAATAADQVAAAKIDAVAMFGDPINNPLDTRIAALPGVRHGGALRVSKSDHRTLRAHLPMPDGAVMSWCQAGDIVCDFDPTRYVGCLGASAIATAVCAGAVQRGIEIHTSYTDSFSGEAASFLAGVVLGKSRQTSPPSSSGSSGSGNGGDGSPVTVPCSATLADVTIPDGSSVAPGQQVTKIWQIRNCGTSSWAGTQATLVSGNAAPSRFAVPALPAGTSGNITLAFAAPAMAGHYRWTYRLTNSGGSARGTFWLDFNVAGTPVAGPVPAAGGQASCTAFVADGNLPDGTGVDPGQALTKMWRLRNCGTSDWSGLHAARVSGGFGPDTFTVPTNAPGATATVSTTFNAPQASGRYRATYRLVDGAGNYARNAFWVEIVVRAATQPRPSPSTSQPPPNRYGVASYDRLAPGASHAEWYQAWQDFTAASSTLTRLQINVGDPRWAAGAIPVNTTIRLCRDSSCTQQLGSWQAQINNYGTTTAEIGDVHVTKGTTYYLRYDRPDSAHTWAVYYWGPGTYNNLSAAVYGYNP